MDFLKNLFKNPRSHNHGLYVDLYTWIDFFQGFMETKKYISRILRAFLRIPWPINMEFIKNFFKDPMNHNRGYNGEIFSSNSGAGKCYNRGFYKLLLRTLSSSNPGFYEGLIWSHNCGFHKDFFPGPIIVNW